VRSDAHHPVAFHRQGALCWVHPVAAARRPAHLSAVSERGFHGPGGRVVALFVALALSGAMPQMGAVAHEREHRCTCHHAPGEVCSCPGCRRAAADVRMAQLADLPPCHRAAAIAAMEREEREEREPPPGTAVIEGCCDSPERHWMALQGSGPYLRPGSVVLVPIFSDGHPSPARPLPPGEAPGEIPTPPPRRA